MTDPFEELERVSARSPVSPPPSLDTWGVGPEVGTSAELTRIVQLPRRPPLVTERDGQRLVSAEAERLQDHYTQRLGKFDAPCQCAVLTRGRRRCASRLLPVQAWALHEIAQCRGLLGPIGVGDGKTLLDLLAPMVMPECRVAVLLVQANLRDQLLEKDWEFYAQHWHLPNLAGGRWFTPGRPVLHVLAFNGLSSPKASDLLERLQPDTLIIDEAHNLKRREAARTRRFLRYMKAHPNVRVCAWSGTLTSKSIREYAHLSALALREGSPVPREWPVIEEWASALDVSDIPTPPGALEKLCEPGEEVRTGYRRRLVETPGVVSSPDVDQCQASLVFSGRSPVVPEEVQQLRRDLLRTWQRPDGEELVTALDVARCARELACGFYYRWEWPEHVSKELITTWRNARRDWHRELRERLKHPRPHLDSPALCYHAAARAWGDAVPEPELPTWRADSFPAWVAAKRALRDAGVRKPRTGTVWVSDFLVSDAADWLADCGPAIAWFEHAALGSALADRVGAPLYRGGPEDSRQILGEDGSRSIIASIRAHGTGKNLQHAFANQIVLNPPSDGAAWEQLLGRTHRQGQPADEVAVTVYRHTEELKDALDSARRASAYITGTMGGSSKLLKATYGQGMD